MELAKFNEKQSQLSIKSLKPNERSLMLASRGAQLDVIRDAASEHRPSELLAPTMKIHRKGAQELHGVAFHPDAETVMAGGSDGILEIYNVYGHCEPVASFRASQSCVRACGYLPDGKRAFAACDDGTFSLWDLSTCTIGRRFGSSLGQGRFHESAIMDAKPSKDGHLFITADKRGTAMIWDVRTNTSVQRICLGKDSQVTPMLCASWGRDDKMAFIGTGKGSVVMYDLRRGSTEGPVEEFGRPEEINSAFDQGGKRVQLGLELTRAVRPGGAVGLKQTLKRGGGNTTTFPTADIIGRGRIHASIRVPDNPRVTGISVSPEGDMMSTFSSDNVVRVYHADYFHSGDRLICELPHGPVHNFEQPNLKMSWNAAGTHLAVGSADKNVYVYKNMHRIHTMSTDETSSPFGLNDTARALFSGSGQPQLAHALEGHISCVTSVAWHPKEQILGSVGTDGQIILGEVHF